MLGRYRLLNTNLDVDRFRELVCDVEKRMTKCMLTTANSSNRSTQRTIIYLSSWCMTPSKHREQEKNMSRSSSFLIGHAQSFFRINSSCDAITFAVLSAKTIKFFVFVRELKFPPSIKMSPLWLFDSVEQIFHSVLWSRYKTQNIYSNLRWSRPEPKRSVNPVPVKEMNEMNN